MIKSNFYRLIFTVIFLFGSFIFAYAQNGEPPPGGEGFAPPRRPNLLQALGLTKEQVQQLKRINNEWNPRRQKAQRDFREAQRELDESIYLDDSNETIINQRKEAVKLAHDELINTQTTMQTMIRRILTNVQLAKFRQLRQEFAQGQRNPNNRMNNQKNNQPVRPLQKGIIRPNQRP